MEKFKKIELGHRDWDRIEETIVYRIRYGESYVDVIHDFLWKTKLVGIDVTKEDFESLVIGVGERLEMLDLRDCGVEVVDFEEAGRIAKGKSGY